MDFEFSISDEHLRRERQKARELRRSRWWQSRLANARCYYCEKPLSVASATMDHIVPLGQGGRSTPGNVVPACKPCNTAKSDMTAAEWALTQSAAAGTPSVGAAAQLHHIGDDGQES